MLRPDAMRLENGQVSLRKRVTTQAMGHTDALGKVATAASTISSANLAQIELLIVSGFWYLVMTSVLGFPQRALEKRYGRGFESVGGRATPRAFKVGRR